MTAPLVSVITPTWQRHDLLLDRCIPSVQAQTHENVEHIVVSDGPDEKLRDKLYGQLPVRPGLLYRELPEHPPGEHYGHHARLLGLDYAVGEIVCYIDDDDALRPDHCRLMAEALEAEPSAEFAVSRMVCHGAHSVVVGWGALGAGNVGSPMIAHRRSVLEHGTWTGGWLEDWELVARWLDAGVKYVNVDAETVDVYPSRFR